MQKYSPKLTPPNPPKPSRWPVCTGGSVLLTVTQTIDSHTPNYPCCYSLLPPDLVIWWNEQIYCLIYVSKTKSNFMLQGKWSNDFKSFFPSLVILMRKIWKHKCHFCVGGKVCKDKREPLASLSNCRPTIINWSISDMRRGIQDDIWQKKTFSWKKLICSLTWATAAMLDKHQVFPR